MTMTAKIFILPFYDGEQNKYRVWFVNHRTHRKLRRLTHDFNTVECAKRFLSRILRGYQVKTIHVLSYEQVSGVSAGTTLNEYTPSVFQYHTVWHRINVWLHNERMRIANTRREGTRRAHAAHEADGRRNNGRTRRVEQVRISDLLTNHRPRRAHGRAGRPSGAVDNT